MITCQHEWVKECQSRYRVEPPTGYHFEEAHYPLSKKLGGISTVKLWYPDHIIQGCLQTLNLDYPCIDTRKLKAERAIVEKVYPTYLQTYDEAFKKCKAYAGKIRAATTNSYLHTEKTAEGKSQHAVKMGKKALASGAIRKANEARSTRLSVTDSNGTTTTFPSMRAACRFYSLDIECLSNCLKNKRPISRGKNKGLTFTLV